MEKKTEKNKNLNEEGTLEKFFRYKNFRITCFLYLLRMAKASRKIMAAKEEQLCADMEEYHRDLLAKRPMEYWRRDFRFCYDFYGADLETDYFGNAMIGRNLRYKRKIVTDRKNMFATDYLVSPDAKSLCRDKVKSAVVWADWYKRRWCTSTPKTPVSVETLRWVSNGKSSVIVKREASR